MRLKGLTAMLGVFAALAAAPGASAQTIGADLNRPANMPFGCDAFPGTDFAGFRAYYATGAQSCTYVGTGNLGGQETAGALGPGVLTQVRVRAAAPTGPVQATIVRATRSGVGFACCFYATASAPFVPAPNAVTAVNVRLPMRSDLNPDFGETVDYLALTVLGLGYPVPAFDGGQPGDVQRSAALAFFPHIRPGDERADGSGAGDFVPLIQGSFASICGASALRPKLEVRYRRGAAGCVGALAIAGAVARAEAGNALLQLLCNDPLGCRGAIRLRGSGGQSRLAKRGKKPTYAKGSFALAPGAENQVSAKLTGAGKRLLRERRSAKVKAKITLEGGTVNGLSAKLKLKR